MTVANSMDYPRGMIEQGTTISIRCWDGFVLIGEESMTCGDNGQWSASAPLCVKIGLF